MDKLCKIYRHLGDSLDLAETLATFDDNLHSLIGYDAISIHLVEDGRLAPAYAAGADFQILASPEGPAGSELLRRVAATRRHAFNRVPDWAGRLVVALAMPLALPSAPAAEYKDRALAVLTLYRLESNPFNFESLEFLTEISAKLATCIQHSQQFQRMECASARTLFERLDAEVARTRRGGGRLAILECAVAGLDPAGPAADRMAAELRTLCREYDFVARSGSSFVVMLADFMGAGLAQKQLRIESVFRNAGLSATIGVALYPEDGADAEDLLAAAHGAAHA